MIECSDVVMKYRKLAADTPSRPMSFEAFARVINVDLNKKFPFTWAHWRAIEVGNYRPDFYAMWYLAEHGHGWVKDFALEMAALLGGE